MTSFGSVQTNGYNGDGLRAWKQTSSGRTYYIYDGDQVVGEFGSGNNYLSGLNTWGANGLLARHTRAGSWYYMFDMQGNVSQKLDRGNTLLSSSIFDPAGNLATTDTNPDPYSGFGGQWGYVSDYETGLTLLGHRFYDYNTQRFLTRDPIGYAGGVNLYAYVGNNPVNEGDPSGHGAVPWPGVRAGAGGAAAIVAYLLLLWCMRHPNICFGPTPPHSGAPPTTAPPPTTGGPVSVGKPVHDPGELGLPTGNCPHPYVHPGTWKPGNELPGRTGRGGKPEYKDDDGDFWRKGPEHHFPGDGWEWDVQGKNGGHINVGRAGGQAPGVVRGKR